MSKNTTCATNFSFIMKIVQNNFNCYFYEIKVFMSEFHSGSTLSGQFQFVFWQYLFCFLKSDSMRYQK